MQDFLKIIVSYQLLLNTYRDLNTQELFRKGKVNGYRLESIL